MKIPNNYLVVAGLMASSLLFSCSKDSTTNQANQQSSETSYKVFENEEDLYSDGKKYFDNLAKEEAILAKNFHSKLSALNLEDVEAKQNNEHIISLLKEFHKNKVNYIRNSRQNSNNISIQSISDEINSLIAYDKEEADFLFNEYKDFLIRSKYGVRPIADPYTSVFLSKNGVIEIEDKVYKVSKENIKVITTNGNTITPDQIENLSDSDDLDVEIRENHIYEDYINKSSSRDQDEDGLFPDIGYLYDEPVYMLTWQCGFSVSSNTSYMNVLSWYRDYSDPSATFLPFPSYSLDFTGYSETKWTSSCGNIYVQYSGSNNSQYICSVTKYPPVGSDDYCSQSTFDWLSCNAIGTFTNSLPITAGGYIQYYY